MFIFSASITLCCERVYIIQNYKIVTECERQRKLLLSQFLNKQRSIRLLEVEILREFLYETKVSPRIFAVCLTGPYQLVAALIALNKMKIATVFWKMGRAAKTLLTSSGVRLIDLASRAGTVAIMDEILSAHREGYNIFLIVETPMASRRRYKFFGYSVTCSSLIETLSKRFGWDIYVLDCSLKSDTEVRVQFTDLISGPDITQKLLRRCEAVALANIGEYIWTPASIVLSDPAAYINGLTFLPEILTWRDQRGQSR